MPTKPALIDLTGDSDTAVPAAASSKPTKHKNPHTKQKILSFLRLHRSPTAPAHFQLSQLPPTPALALANASTQLINTTMVDRGWACGYRNCQMLLSSLLDDTRYHMHERFPCSVPSVRALQECLELAWRDGFDPDGAEQMGRRVVGGRKWVGTTEIYCILAHFGVPAKIVDFHRPTAADGTNPTLFAWMVEYFIASEGGERRRHPVYLQHQGHSRTVVGVEMAEEGVSLVLFDPDVAVLEQPEIKHFRFRLCDTRGVEQYQVLYVDEDENVFAPEYVIPNLISSVRIP
ncbi:hypothetical protein LPJ66_008175 [Kickxella alabastrina]|uniref:Uncharacterized protein n=1 Tax=Kickxella alabastrina TaxID=61397 RepID=A0ACC1I6T9_9FUNG|nr:hypothetical protein LPJ66_008175 [Kickxella alabastrina]